MSAIGPLPAPAPGCNPAAPAALTEDQQTKYDQLLTEVRSWETLPTTKSGTETAAISDHERLWLTRECLLRYLRATKWNLQQAIQRLKATLVWRREFGAESLTADYIAPENEKGKQVQLGFDNEGRPCLYLLPQNQNTKPSQRQVEHLVYMLEKTVDLQPAGQEGLALLIDFRNTSAGGTPPMSQSKQVLDILQSHYPERMGKCLLTHLPWYVTAFLKIIGPFIDPVTKAKLRYNEPLTEYIPAAQLMTAAGGELDFKYDHAVYWPALTSMAAERRQQRTERWEKAGKLIGESEVYLWGGEEGSVGSKKEETVEVNGEEKAVENVNDEIKAPAPAPAEANGVATSSDAATSNGERELVDGVADLNIKTSEPVKTA